MKRICVIIPVHKPQLASDEQLSLQQCRKILYNYDIFLIHPEGLNVEAYLEIDSNLKSKPVPGSWLSSLLNYNRMKRNIDFYQLFSDYDYLLTYELDAYIFSDDWERANCFEYDYIGAPWFKSWKSSDNASNLLGSGNSGFSLRNIQSCIRVLQATNKIKKSWKTFSRLQLHRLISFTTVLHLFDKNWRPGIENAYLPQLTSETIMEDIFWADVVPHIFYFKTGNVKNSVQFSFEINPALLFKVNNYELPLGCHAWKKYDPEFWKPYIDAG